MRHQSETATGRFRSRSPVLPSCKPPICEHHISVTKLVGVSRYPEMVAEQSDMQLWENLRAAYGNTTFVSVSGNCLVRWCYFGFRHRLQHPTASTGPSSMRSVSLVSLEEWELLPMAPFGASSLFDKLATKLQFRDKVASRQRVYALYRGSAPFTVGKTRATLHRSAAARSTPQRQAAMPLSFSRQQPFLVTRGRGSGCLFCQRGGR